MARLARVVVPEMPHHIIQRGNRRLDVFFSEEDRMMYLTLLRRACQRYGVHVWAYCLMRNHVHVIAVPKEERALARCFADVHVRYTRRINFREGWRGHLWQARFGSSVLDERYLLAAVRYVERNPVKAGIVALPWQYPWSSARWHVGEVSADPVVTGEGPLRALVSNWREYLLVDEDETELAKLEQEVRVNRPLGSAEFLHTLEERIGRPITRRKPGRPQKNRWLSPDKSD